LLQAAFLVRQQVPKLRILLVGDGPRRLVLESLAAELGLAEAVRFLGTQSDIPGLLALSNVVVLSSHNEANPVSLLEAMAAEKPVVATRVGSVAETVIDGVTGYLVQPGDGGEFAERVAGLLKDPGEAAAMGRAGREHVVARWSVEQMVRGYEDLLAEIYQRKAGGGPAPVEGGLLAAVRPVG
jgi:glycosyltransferase involved in cell wall biosynthesis